MTEPDYWCRNELIYDRDWPSSLIVSLLGEPDRVYSSDSLGYCVMLFSVPRVVAAERNEVYRAHHADCEQLRRDGARRHQEAVSYANACPVFLTTVDAAQLLEKGTKHECQRFRHNKTSPSKHSILLGIILRELIDLPRLLAKIDHCEFDARQILTIRALNAVASVYPALAEACQFRQAKLQKEARRHHRRRRV